MEKLEKKILLEIDNLISKLEKMSKGEILLPSGYIHQPDEYAYKQLVKSILEKIDELERDFTPNYTGNAIKTLSQTLFKEVYYLEKCSKKELSVKMNRVTKQIKIDINSIIIKIKEIKEE